ncbi:MAG: glycoside hydrolase family 5 protein [Cyclobacteriaceae bacterium]|nr:glycoside hydrolase family 5 protein [Cyclobacteriaceae bacterium]
MVQTSSAQDTKMDWLRVEGNAFVKADGNKIIMRGINFSDPDRLEKIGQWKPSLFETAAAWGSNVVRLPIHPAAWRSRGKDDYLKLIDQAVEWAKSNQLYIVIDWHSIGNLRTTLYQHPMYYTTLDETWQFWYTIADRYKNEPVVAFYEIFNEPTTADNRYGSLSWSQWKEMVTDIIVMIRANNPKAIPLVGGFNWAYDLTPVMNEPLNIQGIAYVSHPYPQKRAQPWEPQWERDYGFVADKYPVFATEIGYQRANEKGAHVPVIADETYAEAITQYFDKKGISYVAWVFDTEWSPQLISDWNYTPTRSGAFFKGHMTKKGNRTQ